VQTPCQWPRFFKHSFQREIYKLNGIGHLFAWRLVSWFSGKSLKLLPSDVIFYCLQLKCIKFDFAWGSAPDPIGDLTTLPRHIMHSVIGWPHCHPVSNKRRWLTAKSSQCQPLAAQLRAVHHLRSILHFCLLMDIYFLMVHDRSLSVSDLYWIADLEVAYFTGSVQSNFGWIVRPLDVTAFRSFNNNTGKRVLDLLEVGDLRLR